ncbi:25252_t:CDS:2, partial [Gigaspora rosea]
LSLSKLSGVRKLDITIINEHIDNNCSMTITKEPKPVKNDNTTQATKRKNMLDYWGKSVSEVASPILSKETSNAHSKKLQSQDQKR